MSSDDQLDKVRHRLDGINPTSHKAFDEYFGLLSLLPIIEQLCRRLFGFYDESVMTDSMSLASIGLPSFAAVRAALEQVGVGDYFAPWPMLSFDAIAHLEQRGIVSAYQDMYDMDCENENLIQWRQGQNIDYLDRCILKDNQIDRYAFLVPDTAEVRQLRRVIPKSLYRIQGRPVPMPKFCKLAKSVAAHFGWCAMIREHDSTKYYAAIFKHGGR